jgi:hypothetical protein
MPVGPFRPWILLPYVVLLAGIGGLVSVPSNIAESSLQPYQATTTSTACTVSVESSLTVHVVDADGAPVPDAAVLLNGAYVCNGQVYLSNFSGTTDSEGNAAFGVVPGAKYNVTVIPPSSLAGRSVVSVITAPHPTMSATTTIAVRSQGATTVSVDYPRTAFVKSGVIVALSTSWSGANAGDYLRVTLWDHDVNQPVQVLPKGTPTPCNRYSDSGLNYGICIFPVSAPVGTEHVTYEVVAPAQNEVWSLEGSAELCNAKLQCASSTVSLVDVKIEVTSPPELLTVLTNYMPAAALIAVIALATVSVAMLIVKRRQKLLPSPSKIENRFDNRNGSCVR